MGTWWLPIYQAYLMHASLSVVLPLVIESLVAVLSLSKFRDMLTLSFSLSLLSFPNPKASVTNPMSIPYISATTEKWCHMGTLGLHKAYARPRLGQLPTRNFLTLNPKPINPKT